MAMANPFRDLDLLMDHNTASFTSSTGAMASSSSAALLHPPDSTPQSLDSQSSAMDAPPSPSSPSSPSSSSSSSPHAAARHGFAALSLAMAPAFLASPSLAPRPNASSHSLNPSPGSAARRPTTAAAPSPPPGRVQEEEGKKKEKRRSKTAPSAAAALLTPAITAAAMAPAPTATGAEGSKRRGLRKEGTAFPDLQKLPDASGSFREPGGAAAMRRASIMWFRNDLRCHDNEALLSASRESLALLPVYCFDPRDYGRSTSGFDKTGPYRARFLLECVSALREKLRTLGSELLVRIGKPEEVLLDLARSIGAEAVYASQEVSCEELKCEGKVSAAMAQEGIEARYFWGSTLFHIEDLPFELASMPSTYSAFRESVRKLEVRKAMAPPKKLTGLPSLGGVELGEIPTLQQLGLRPVPAQKQDGQAMVAGASLVGGETEALQRLKSFAQDHLKQSKDKKPSASGGYGESQYGSNFSCKISPWLAMGCLSPRRMFEDLKSNSRSGTSISASGGSPTNDNGLNWLVFELLWRDFFRFITKKYAASKDGVVASPSTAALAA